jgi:hypothetical protein
MGWILNASNMSFSLSSSFLKEGKIKNEKKDCGRSHGEENHRNKKKRAIGERVGVVPDTSLSVSLTDVSGRSSAGHGIRCSGPGGFD